jgi:hypothetical protein
VQSHNLYKGPLGGRPGLGRSGLVVSHLKNAAARGIESKKLKLNDSKLSLTRELTPAEIGQHTDVSLELLTEWAALWKHLGGLRRFQADGPKR